MKSISFLLLACLALPAFGEDYVKSIEDWQARRLEGLRKPFGWLSLTGLYWLKEGDNSFGRSSSCAVVFPKGPEHLGIFRVQGKSLEVIGGEDLQCNGERVSSLKFDAGEPEGTHSFTCGSQLFYVVVRDGRLGVRLKDCESPTRLHFKGLEFFPVTLAWRLEAHFEAHSPVQKIRIPSVLGGETLEDCPGALVFQVGGQNYRLEAIQEQGEHELFVIFADKTSGHTTYGAGRFLNTPLPDADGKVVVDFNRAYTPPCGFTSFATCPLPPKGNRLSTEICAGEKYSGH